MSQVKNQSSGPPTQYRQGDVLLIAVEQAPEGCTPIPNEAGRFVLAHGEATGHAHAISTQQAEFFEEPDTERRFLLIPGDKGGELRHEEHGPIHLRRGVYEVRRQREFRPPTEGPSPEAASHNFSWVAD